MAGKRKKRKKVVPFRRESNLTYNPAKPNRQARRLGIKPQEPKQEKKPVSKGALLNRRVKQAREMQKRITPPGMTYGEYLAYLTNKRQQMEEKNKTREKSRAE